MLRISSVKNISQICPALVASAALDDNLGPTSKYNWKGPKKYCHIAEHVSGK